MTEPLPALGALAMDTASGRIGTLTDHMGGTAWLRPVGGGREWPAKAGGVRAATAAETLSAPVAEANARSRERLREGQP